MNVDHFINQESLESFLPITPHTFKLRDRAVTIYWYSWDCPFATTEVLWFDAPPRNRKQPKDIRGAFCNQHFVLTGLGGTVRFRIGQSSDLGVGEVDVKAPFEIIEYSLHAWEHPTVNFLSLDPPVGSIPSRIPEISSAAWKVIAREAFRLIGVDGIAIAPNTENPDFDQWDYQIKRNYYFSDIELRDLIPTGRAHALDLKHVRAAVKLYDPSTHHKHGLARQEFQRISQITGFGYQSVRKQITEGIKQGLIQIPPKKKEKSK